MTMRCHYEVLEIEDRGLCTESELKKRYYKLCLKWHPDKNNAPEAKGIFQLIQNAYETLSDPQERKWYDDHREQILRGDEVSTGEDGDWGQSSQVINLWKYFSAGIFSDYSDEPKGFYTVYRYVFDELQSTEPLEEHSDIETMRMVPSFGSSTTSGAEVQAFYNFWTNFVTSLTFSWCDRYKVSDGETRVMRRQMEKENKRFREVGRKKYMEQVRALADFVRKRDRRWSDYMRNQEREKEHQRLAEERRRAQLEATFQQERELFAQEQSKLWEAEELAREQLSPTARSKRLADLEIEEALLEQDKKWNAVALYCQPCKKTFKSKKQLQNHAQSKKHKEKIAHFSEENLEFHIDLNEDQKEEDIVDEDFIATASAGMDLKVEPVVVDTKAMQDKVDAKAIRAAKEAAAAAKRQERKAKRKEKKQQPQGNNSTAKAAASVKETFSCSACNGDFLSRNDLFGHLKKNPRHAQLK